MNRTLPWALALALLSAACGTSTVTSSGGGVAADGGGSDSAGGSAGDSSKNKATIGTTSDSGAKSTVSVDKAATKEDTQAASNKLGATSADKQLILWMTSVEADGTKVLEVHIDTDKYPLPASAIPAGDMNSGAWVQYTVAGAAATGAYSSKGTGTIDISTCPTANGVAVVGKLSGVKVESDATAVGPKSFTLDGPFNLVYFGGVGALACKAPEPTPDAGSTDGGAVNVGQFKPPAGSTCDANPCDGGSNTTRGCCPYVPCMGDCIGKCATGLNTCVTNCATGNPMEIQGCMTSCIGDYFKCHKSCLTSCNVSGACNAAYGKLVDCEEKNAATCMQEEDEAAQDKCMAEKCCAELKAAF